MFQVVAGPMLERPIGVGSRIIKSEDVQRLQAAVDVLQLAQARHDAVEKACNEAVELARGQAHRQGRIEGLAQMAQALAGAHASREAAMHAWRAAFARHVALATARLCGALPARKRLDVVVDQAVKDLDEELAARLFVHPDSADGVRLRLGTARGRRMLNVVEDAGLPLDGCRLEADAFVIEHDWREVLAGIEAAGLAAMEQGVSGPDPVP